MSKEIADRLYELLPAIYRIRDCENDRPLQALLSVLAKQAGFVEEDITKLYDNWFIETCDEWVVPYIGDLLNARSIHRVDSKNLTMRAYVANTLSYRRRKGTVTVLEQLGHDVTGWKVRAVEFFKLMIANQNVNHLRLDNLATIKIRDDPFMLENGEIGLKDDTGLENLNGPFEQAAHTVEVRNSSTHQGKYNIPNIGLFLWRLQSYPITSGTARRISDGCYTFSPLGNDMHLFNLPQTENIVDHLTDEKDVPGLIRPRAFRFDLQEYLKKYEDTIQDKKQLNSAYYGPDCSLRICKDSCNDSNFVKPTDIIAKNLCQWERPESGKVAIDVVLGRISFATGESPTGEVLVNYGYGFAGDIGGGPYDRQGSLSDVLSRTVTWQVGVGKDIKQIANEKIFDKLADAIDEWNDQPPGTLGIIAIMDNRTYQENSGEKLEIKVPESSQLTIIAADWPIVEDPGRSVSKGRIVGQIIVDELRPHLIADISIEGTSKSNSRAPGGLILNGLLIEGALTVEVGNLGELDIVHSTIVPGIGLTENGRPINSLLSSVSVDASNDQLRMELDHSIVGPLRIPEEMVSLTARDSIIDSPLRDARAELIPAIQSGSLTEPIFLTSASPSLDVMMGNEGPYRIKLSPGAKTLDQAASQLQNAISSASNTNAFTGARVISLGDMLLILPGLPIPVIIKAVKNINSRVNIEDPTASELRLDFASSIQMIALVSGKSSSFPLSSASPKVGVIVEKDDQGDGDPLPVILPQAPKTLDEASKQLQDAIRGVSDEDTFKSANVLTIDGRLIVLPGRAMEQTASGEPPRPLMFRSVPGDSTTLLELALESATPAISGSDDGIIPGPGTALERTTVFGRVHVKELEMVSEVIFNDPAVSDRLQAGCVRFSFVPEGSLTPRRYRCQPDLALEKKAESDMVAGRKIESAMYLSESERDLIIASARPEFTSDHFGKPGYAQLSLDSAGEIRTGAEDGSEMGVFSSLKQPQREANLLSVLDEYLRFGLEAGLFFVA